MQGDEAESDADGCFRSLLTRASLLCDAHTKHTPESSYAKNRLLKTPLVCVLLKAELKGVFQGAQPCRCEFDLQVQDNVCGLAFLGIIDGNVPHLQSPSIIQAKVGVC